jgi:hypothetical protein
MRSNNAKVNHAKHATNDAKVNITKLVNSTYCNGFPIRKFFAIVILILNIVSLCSKLYTQPSFFYFLIFVDILYVSLWAYYGYYYCHPVTTFFVQMVLTLVLLILMPFFLVYFVVTELSAAIEDASSTGSA